MSREQERVRRKIPRLPVIITADGIEYQNQIPFGAFDVKIVRAGRNR